MNHKQRMLAAITGKSVDQIPWAPRLDLWYRANHQAGTLPAPYQKASLMEIVDDMDMAFHAVVPAFRDLRTPADDIDRALGLYNLHFFPYRLILENIERKIRVDGDRTHVEYLTPFGNITTTVLYDQGMQKAGISITHVAEHAFKEIKDYRVLGYIFENIRVVPNGDGYRAFAETIGDRGLAVGFINLAASPMHLIQRELMPLDTFFFEAADHGDELSELADKIGGFWTRLLKIAADCSAEVFLLGANYDASVTYPPFFHQHILPWLKRFGEMLHAKGKFLLTHTDGENTGLLDHFLASGFDIADSICPKPMTKLTFREIRDAFAGKITIMGGIPSIALLPGCMPDREFETFLEQFFDDIQKGDHLILGISDTTPPAADFNRIIKIGQRIKAFGPVNL